MTEEPVSREEVAAHLQGFDAGHAAGAVTGYGEGYVAGWEAGQEQADGSFQAGLEAGGLQMLGSLRHVLGAEVVDALINERLLPVAGPVLDDYRSRTAHTGEPCASASCGACSARRTWVASRRAAGLPDDYQGREAEAWLRSPARRAAASDGTEAGR